jgi:hypothetical protein
MMMSQRSILLCTVGISLFTPNLEGLKRQLAAGTLAEGLHPLAEAFSSRRITATASGPLSQAAE